METRLSKTLSYLLRHGPDEAGLSMDDQGFVALEELLGVLQERGWSSLTGAELRDKIDEPEVDRFERVGSAVRATYGHSVEVDLDYPEIEPPEELYHGTSRSAWSSIQNQGIQPMNRQYVHLSRTVQEARRVGRRHDDQPVILVVHPPDSTPQPFYQAGPVVLTETVPPEWVAKR